MFVCHSVLCVLLHAHECIFYACLCFFLKLNIPLIYFCHKVSRSGGSVCVALLIYINTQYNTLLINSVSSTVIFQILKCQELNQILYKKFLTETCWETMIWAIFSSLDQHLVLRWKWALVVVFLSTYQIAENSVA